MTINVLRKQRLVDYQPTLLIGKRIEVITGIPRSIRHRTAIQHFIEDNQLLSREFFFGVRSGAAELTVGHHHRSGRTSFMRITKSNGEYTATAAGHCEWWKLEQSGR